jgi:hypothetical protein
MKRQVLFLLVTAAFFSCSQPGDTHLGDLRSAERDVNAGMSTLSAWNVDSVAAARERVAMRFQDLDWLVADSSLVYTVEDGQLIGDWARVKRFLKDGPTRLTTLDKQGELCLSQLDNLMHAIRGGATEDAKGMRMDEAYFDKEAARELKAAAQWGLAVDETERLISLGIELEDATRASIDSLIRVKRAEWAATLSNENGL